LRQCLEKRFLTIIGLVNDPHPDFLESEARHLTHAELIVDDEDFKS
jgi:hypothetical protein